MTPAFDRIDFLLNVYFVLVLSFFSLKFVISLCSIVSRLQKLCSDGYQVVIITNQGGIGKGKLTISAFAKKVCPQFDP